MSPLPQHHASESVLRVQAPLRVELAKSFATGRSNPICIGVEEFVFRPTARVSYPPQQFTCPSLSNAHEPVRDEAMAVAPERDATWVGDRAWVGRPDWPWELPPQHQTVLSFNRAQA